MDLLKRGHELQKSSRRKHLGEPLPIAAVSVLVTHLHMTLSQQIEMQISMCKMRRKGRGGAYSRDGVSIEVVADRSDTYDKLLERALQISERRSTLSLFTLAGAVIICDDRDNESNWSLGEYLRRVRRSPSELKLGIGPKPVSYLVFC